MELRTEQQFRKIHNSCENGNWNKASKEVIEYGFFAEDLIDMNIRLEGLFSDKYDIARLIEQATKIRYNGNN